MTTHENRAEETTQDPGWSWWWLLVALPAFLAAGILMAFVLVPVVGPNPVSFILYDVFTIVAAFATPVSLLALYSDARHLRRIDSPWQPDGWKYALVAVLIAIVVVAGIGIEAGDPGAAFGQASAGLLISMTPVGLFYLYRRYRAVGIIWD